MNPKILIGCPTADEKSYCLKEYLKGLEQLTWQNKEIVIVDNSETDDYIKELRENKINTIKDLRLEDVKERIAHSRNILREKTLSEGFDYFLSLEQDVIPPPDMIEKLLAHGKEAITGVYFTIYQFQGQPKLRPLVWKENPESSSTMIFMNEDVKAATGNQNELTQIKAAGLGCMLIHRRVLEKIKLRP